MVLPKLLNSILPPAVNITSIQSASERLSWLILFRTRVCEGPVTAAPVVTTPTSPATPAVTTTTAVEEHHDHDHDHSHESGHAHETGHAHPTGVVVTTNATTVVAPTATSPAPFAGAASNVKGSALGFVGLVAAIVGWAL